MRIVVLNFNLKGIGTYRRSFYFSRELARYGHNVTMVTVSRDSKFRPRVYYKRDWLSQSDQPTGGGPWVRIIEGPRLGYKWLPGWGSGPLDIWLRVKEILTDDYDVVYGFEYHPNVSWPVYLTKPLKRYRFYSDWCDWFAGHSNQFRGIKIAHQLDKWFEEHIRFLAEKVTVTSQVLKERARSIGIPEAKIVYIPEGAATDYIQPLPKGEGRRRFGIPDGIPILLTSRERHLDHQIKIFAEVLRRVTNSYLVIIGNVPKEALKTAEELGIADHVRFAGWVSDEDYPLYLACADICYLPLENTLLHRARWPAKILDYLSAGRPVVTSDVGEVGALFKQHEVGILVGQSDEEFVESIVALINDEERCQFLGKNARRIMVEEWDWRVRGKQIARVVEE